MVERPDYRRIEPPENKPKEQWTTHERRADILRRIEERGHPWGFNKSAIAREFDVTADPIINDFDVLKDFYNERIGEHAKAQSEWAYKKIYREHLENGDLEKARRALDSWNDFLFETGAQERAARKVDADVTNREAADESESYEIISDDESIEDAREELERAENA